MNEMYAVIREGDSNELQHYGVLGMKWGIHRAQKKGTSVDAQDSIFHRTKSRTTRGLERRLKKDAKRVAKGKEGKYDTKSLTNALEKSRAQDKALQDYTAKQSIGKTVLKTALMGSRGALRYNQARTGRFGDGAKSRIGGAAAAYGSNLLRGYETAANVVRGISTSHAHKKKKK